MSRAITNNDNHIDKLVLKFEKIEERLKKDGL